MLRIVINNIYDIVEAPVQPEEKPVSRPGSPLGRRITQMFRGFSSKKKVPTVDDVAAKKEEETPEVSAEVAAPSAEVTAATGTIDQVAVEALAHEEHDHVIPSSVPVIQASV